MNYLTYQYKKIYFLNYYLNLKMSEENSYDLRLSQARALSGQLGLFAEENEIPKDLWDRLESEIYNYFEVNLN